MLSGAEIDVSADDLLVLPEPVGLVPNSVDTSSFRPSDRREWTVALMPRRRQQETSLLKCCWETIPGLK
ncbi:hypothetical protein NLX83_27755 [Allokutzneria sp. A3M-2-11 16]|uniref:hypothetical protein n=1 Tax=Allokutzneria sp. A3M-2-11 16 TaxID=2962043 RepID=UPI0020B6B862|nr:hypothetical protein [Allokutzneria sp. A3M-2-11 16]MCP3803077.1 hypothetical protein [Allokutzneria sp. A3M-2-11 16]